MSVRPSKRTVRAAVGLVAVLCVLLLAGSFLAESAPAAGAGGPARAPAGGADSAPAGSGTGGELSFDEAESITVVSTQGFYRGTHPGARQTAKLVAFAADGTVLYQNASHGVYFDVDPVPGTRYTVEYVAADRVGNDACESGEQCTRNVVERVNLSTGEVTRVYGEVTPRFNGGRWHDVDRLNETHLVVADIVFDRVFVVDTRTDEIDWHWTAASHYTREQGGSQQDWTHLNDVEVLADGRVTPTDSRTDTRSSSTPTAVASSRSTRTARSSGRSKSRWRTTPNGSAPATRAPAGTRPGRT